MDDNRLERIEDKIDKIADKLTEHAILHERNTVSLQEHMRRTDSLEIIITQNKSKVDASLVPLTQTDHILRASIKAIGVLASLAALIYTMIKLVGK